MIDFPIGALMDESLCSLWLERHLHPAGLTCPHGGPSERRPLRAQGHLPAYRWRACEGYDTLLTGTAFAKTRQRPATLVLRRRGVVKGEPTARLAREVGLSRKPLHTLRQRLQAQLNATAPTQVRAGTAFEADELYPNAGGKTHAPWRSQRSATPPRQEAQGARDLCQRPAPPQQHHLAGHGRGPLLGV